MAEVIQGLQVDVPGQELKELLEGRLKYHIDKANFCEKQLESMREVGSALAEEAVAIGKVSSVDVLDSTKQALQRHKNSMTYYSFLVKHVSVNSIYRLGESDLIRLGIQGGRF